MFNISFQTLRPLAGGFLAGKKFNFVSHANDELRPDQINRESDPERAERMECLVKVRQKIKRMMYTEKVPGLVIAISLHGKVIYRAAFGYKDLENAALTTCDDRGPVASVSKTFCAHLLLKAVMEQNKMHVLQEDFRNHIRPDICPIKMPKRKRRKRQCQPPDRVLRFQHKPETPDEMEDTMTGSNPEENQYIVWQRWPIEDDLLCRFDGDLPVKWLLCHMTGLQALERSEIVGCTTMTDALARHFKKADQESSSSSSSCQPGPSGLSSSGPPPKGPRRGAGDWSYGAGGLPPNILRQQRAFIQGLTDYQRGGRLNYWEAVTILDRDWAFKRNIYNNRFLMDNCPMATWFAGWPGLQFSYSNLGYHILAHIIEYIDSMAANSTGTRHGGAYKKPLSYNEIGKIELRRLHLSETMFNMKGDVSYNFSYMTGYKKLEEENAAGMWHTKARIFDLSCRLGSEGLGSSCSDLLKWAHFNMKCYQNTDRNNGMLFSHEFMKEHQWSLRHKYEAGDGQTVDVKDHNKYTQEEKKKKEVRGYGMGWKVAMTNPYKFFVDGDDLTVQNYDQTKKRPWVFRFWHNGCAPGHKAICYTRIKAGDEPRMSSLVDRTEERGRKPTAVVGTQDMYGKWSFHKSEQKCPQPLLSVDELQVEISGKRDRDYEIANKYNLKERYRALYEANRKMPITLDPEKTPPKKEAPQPSRRLAHRQAYLDRNKPKKTQIEIWGNISSVPCNNEIFNLNKENRCDNSGVEGVAIAIIANINTVEMERFCDQVSDLIWGVFESDTEPDTDTDTDYDDDDDDDYDDDDDDDDDI